MLQNDPKLQQQTFKHKKRHRVTTRAVAMAQNELNKATSGSEKRTEMCKHEAIYKVQLSQMVQPK